MSEYTIDLCEGGTASAIGHWSSWTAANAFDNNPNTGWHYTGAFPSWLQYQFTEPKKIAKYTITSRYLHNSQVPRDWTFQGSNNESDWDVLDTHVDDHGLWDGVYKVEFPITNSTSYEYYRIVITRDNGTPSLMEVEMMEKIVTNPYIRPDTMSELFNVVSRRGNIRGKAAEGFVRPTIKQFFMSVPDYIEVDGYRSPTGIGDVSSDAALNSEHTENNNIAKLDDTHFIWARTETLNDRGKVSICTLDSNGTVTEGPITSFGGVAQNWQIRRVRVAKLTDTKIALAWIGNYSNQGKVCIGDISGSTITVGGQHTVHSAYDLQGMGLIRVADDKIALCYSRNKADGHRVMTRGGSVSGTTISFGSENLINGTATINKSVSYSMASFEDNKLIFTYSTGIPGDTTNTRLGTMSGSTISWNSSREINTLAWVYGSAQFEVESGKVLLFCADKNNIAFSVLTTSGNSITNHTTLSNITSGFDIGGMQIEQLDSTHYSIIYMNADTYVYYARIGTLNIDNNTMSLSSAVTLCTNAISSHLASRVINDDQIIAIRQKSSASNYAHYNVLEIERD